jgi:hypothetical protein
MITLHAESAYGQKGHFIGRVTGPDKKWGVALDFVGSSVTIPGLFKIRNIGKKGSRDDSWALVWRDGDNLRVEKTLNDEEVFSLLERGLTEENINDEGRREEACQIRMRQPSGSQYPFGAKTLDESFSGTPYGIDRLDCKPSTIGELIEARSRRNNLLEGVALAPDKSALLTEKLQLLARIEEINKILESL